MKKSLFGKYKKIWLLGLILLCAVASIVIFAETTNNKFNVSFENYDGTQVQTVSDVPLGTQLYTKTELQEKLGDAFSPAEDSSFYLYYPGTAENETFGPLAVTEPTRGSKYDFKDWKKQMLTKHL